MPSDAMIERLPELADWLEGRMMFNEAKSVRAAVAALAQGAGDVSERLRLWIWEQIEKHGDDLVSVKPTFYLILNKIDELRDESAAQGAVEAEPGWRLVPEYALQWLDGSGPDLDGNWFGDAPEAQSGKPYWWRKKFSDMLAAAPQPPASPPREELERVMRERDALAARLEIGPCGEDAIDVAESAMGHLRARAETAESQLAEARAQLAALSREGGK